MQTIKNWIFYFSPFFFSFSLLTAHSLLEENGKIAESSDFVEELYSIPADQKWKDITQLVLDNPTTAVEARESIIKNERKIILFTYPSDGLLIKGFLSFTPNPEHHPLLIIFRSGNQKFALMNPGISLATYKDYTVISSTLRGGVSEGVDEFGGKDVDDMKNLVEFIPKIAAEIGIQLHPHCTFMLGASRGGLEMFLTLAKHTELQNHVDKIVSLSSILDLHEQILNRPLDMKPMFENFFGMDPKNPGPWIKERDPLETAPFIKSTLPILVIQGTEDKRVHLKEGKNMVNALKNTGHSVDYWEVPGGNHTLTNVPHLMDDVTQWLEAHLDCYKSDPRHYLKKQKK